MENLTENEIDDIKSIAHSYFHDIRFREDTAALETHGRGEIVYEKDKILSYLQTIFFEEHLVEVQLDQTTRTFFAHVADDLPELIEEEEGGDVVVVEPDYESGSYLKKMDYFLLTPLTPGIGNGQIRGSKQIVVRFFVGTTAIELGCTFDRQKMVREVPLLRLNFPIIGRLNRDFRLFRVKVVSTIDAKVLVAGKIYQIFDIGAEGLAFQMPADHPPFEVDQPVKIAIMVSGMSSVELNGTIRNVTKARDRSGFKIACGVQFDLETRSLAADLEKIAAAVQRLHLRELAEKTANMDGVTLIR